MNALNLIELDVNICLDHIETISLTRLYLKNVLISSCDIFNFRLVYLIYIAFRIDQTMVCYCLFY